MNCLQQYLWYTKLNGNIQVISCFGCYINVDHPWSQYVSPDALFDRYGHCIGSLNNE